MTKPKHLSWDNFRSTILVPGQQRVHRVTDSPRIELFGDGLNSRIGIWLETPSLVVVPPELKGLESISTRAVGHDGRFFLEVSTHVSSLLRQFYHFAVAVAERVTVEGRPCVEAVSLELQCFSDLLGQRTLLGIERQLGLLGELLFLERAVDRFGLRALDAWLGPFGEPHDFRFESREFEVKTTVSTQRVHTIHGMGQLVASDKCSLFVVSILLGPPGANKGFSLAETVAQLRTRFVIEPKREEQFSAALDACGLRQADLVHYGREFTLRRPFGVALVDDSFPSITHATVQRALGARAPRVESLHYDINIEGLVHEEGSAEFKEAIYEE